MISVRKYIHKKYRRHQNGIGGHTQKGMKKPLTGRGGKTRKGEAMRVVRLVYEDGSTVELERESHELINEISRLSAIWSVAAYDGDAATLLKYSPRWCEICGKVLSFWGQIGAPKLPASSEEHEADPLKSQHLYMRF